MSFLETSIDRAIVVTQYRLQAFSFGGVGVIEHDQEPEELWDVVEDFLALAARGPEGEPRDESYVRISDSSYDEYRGMCGCLALACDDYQEDAIRLIIQDIAKLSAQMQAEMVASAREPSAYIEPLSRENDWGKAVLALAAAFDVSLKEYRTVSVELTQTALDRFSRGDVRIVHNAESLGEEGVSLLLQGPSKSIRIENPNEGRNVSGRKLVIRFHWIAQNDGEPNAPADTWTYDETISDYGVALDQLIVEGVDACGRLTVAVRNGFDRITMFLPGTADCLPTEKVKGFKSEPV